MFCKTFIPKWKKYTGLTSCSNCRWSWSPPRSGYTFSANNSDADSGSHGTWHSWRSIYGKAGSWTFNNRKVKRFSAKSLIIESKFLQISFTYARNRSGPNTLPCCTPGVTLTSSDNYIPVYNQTITHCKLSFRLQHIKWLYMNINRIYTDFFHCQILNTLNCVLEAASMGEAISFRNVVYCVE